jgi:imidazolonepropionase-like amidohydrolase
VSLPSDSPDGTLSRRRFLAWSAAATAVAACELTDPTRSATTESGRPGPSGATPSAALAEPTGTAEAQAPLESGAPSATPGTTGRRTLYRDGALADARSDRLGVGVSIFVEDGTIRWIRPSDAEPDPGPRSGLEMVDASGTTFVPGMVDGHCHVTMPGGAHWIDRADDPPAVLLDVAERNAGLMTRAGVRWARDVGAPYVQDPTAGRRRALSLGLRERWRDTSRYPYLRAAGTWLTRRGSLPNTVHDLEADNADELLAHATRQLDDGADLVKLYLDGPDPDASPWTSDEIARVVKAVHDRGKRITAHSGRLSGARAGVRGGVDSIEHGFELDRDVAADMTERGTFLVSTLAIMRSWLTFGQTTTLARFTAGRGAIAGRREAAMASIGIARAAGVRIAAGTDAGGGSLRAGHLAWEVEQLVRAGLEPWQALAAATWRGGQLLGEPAAGTIGEGGPADFFLVHGNPLSEPEALWRVWRVAWAG